MEFNKICDPCGGCQPSQELFYPAPAMEWGGKDPGADGATEWCPGARRQTSRHKLGRGNGYPRPHIDRGARRRSSHR